MKITAKITESLNEKFAKLEREIKNNASEVKERLSKEVNILTEKIAQSNIRLNDLQKENSNFLEAIKVLQEKNSDTTKRLWEMRESDKYSKTLDNKEPLVTVRIASYNKTNQIIKRAIPSVLRQTYQNFEIVIVNDGPNPKTRKAIENIADQRIRYYELPYRSRYPDNDLKRWQVAGSPGMNYGAFLARGQWIAPLDDDDEFTEDHIELLLGSALSNKSELVLGSFTQTIVSGDGERTNKVIQPNLPPEYGGCTMQANIYMSCLSDIFEYNIHSYIFNEPGDWNLISRMIESGVRMSIVKKSITNIEYIQDLSSRK